MAEHSGGARAHSKDVLVWMASMFVLAYPIYSHYRCDRCPPGILTHNSQAKKRRSTTLPSGPNGAHFTHTCFSIGFDKYVCVWWICVQGDLTRTVRRCEPVWMCVHRRNALNWIYEYDHVCVCVWVKYTITVLFLRMYECITTLRRENTRWKGILVATKMRIDGRGQFAAQGTYNFKALLLGQRLSE